MVSKKIKYFVCDFETTGVNTAKDYPIEIGGVFLDYKFNIIEVIDQLIYYPEVAEKDFWDRHDWYASTIHKIDFDEYKSNAVPPINIVKEIKKKMDPCDAWPIIISDNAQFEYNFMQKLFTDAGKSFIFHYSAWDTNLLLRLSGIGDPIPVHRAFEDATLLYRNLIRAMEKLGFFQWR